MRCRDAGDEQAQTGGHMSLGEVERFIQESTARGIRATDLLQRDDQASRLLFQYTVTTSSRFSDGANRLPQSAVKVNSRHTSPLGRLEVSMTTSVGMAIGIDRPRDVDDDRSQRWRGGLRGRARLQRSTNRRSATCV